MQLRLVHVSCETLKMLTGPSGRSMVVMLESSRLRIKISIWLGNKQEAAAQQAHNTPANHCATGGKTHSPMQAQLLDSLFGTERGMSASSEVRAEINELITQLEAKSPNLDMMEVPHKHLPPVPDSWFS